ncbi:hypothetical protein D3C72_1799620 [compost metagenome]
MVRNMVLQGAAFHQPHEIFIHHLAQHDGLPLRQRMATRHDDAQRIMAKGLGVQAVQVRRVRQHADIAGARAQGIGNFQAGFFFQVHRHTGMVAQKISQHGRQVFT